MAEELILLRGGDSDQVPRVLYSQDPVDRALSFLHRLCDGSASAYECEALRRNPELDEALRTWIDKANRIVRKESRSWATKETEKRDVRGRPWKPLY